MAILSWTADPLDILARNATSYGLNQGAEVTSDEVMMIIEKHRLYVNGE